MGEIRIWKNFCKAKLSQNVNFLCEIDIFLLGYHRAFQTPTQLWEYHKIENFDQTQQFMLAIHIGLKVSSIIYHSYVLFPKKDLPVKVCFKVDHSLITPFSILCIIYMPTLGTLKSHWKWPGIVFTTQHLALSPSCKIAFKCTKDIKPISTRHFC